MVAGMMAGMMACQGTAGGAGADATHVCDVVRLVGRKFRSKSVAQIMGEVKAAHAAGAETVFFSDDNSLGLEGAGAGGEIGA